MEGRKRENISKRRLRNTIFKRQSFCHHRKPITRRRRHSFSKSSQKRNRSPPHWNILLSARKIFRENFRTCGIRSQKSELIFTRLEKILLYKNFFSDRFSLKIYPDIINSTHPKTVQGYNRRNVQASQVMLELYLSMRRQKDGTKIFLLSEHRVGKRLKKLF